jgi:DNA (cytosine-5)-methyltransferase 1
VKPRIATLEQTFGLATHEEHKRNFLMLLYDIDAAGYDVRYKVQDLSLRGSRCKFHTLMVFILTKFRRGTPLPPFPKPTHGAPGSGLKPFVCIDEALAHITRQGRRAMNDPYHQPKLYPEPRPAYNPRTFLKGCITTGGTTATHPSGTRPFTPRELSLFQSFPYVYQFTGPNCDAKKQIGNAFPPVMAQAVYQIISRTLEAFDNGLIGAEDDLSDLDALLVQRGENDPQQRHTPGLGGFTRSNNIPRTPSQVPGSRTARTPGSQTASPSVRNNGSEPMRSQRRTEDAFPSMNLFDGVLNGISDFADGSTASGSRNDRRRREPSIPDQDDEVIYVPSDSE